MSCYCLQLQKAAPDYGVGINPISRLIQIQQAKKEREPVYSLVMEQGLPRHREFVMEVGLSRGEDCHGGGLSWGSLRTVICGGTVMGRPVIGVGLAQA